MTEFIVGVVRYYDQFRGFGHIQGENGKMYNMNRDYSFRRSIRETFEGGQHVEFQPHEKFIPKLGGPGHVVYLARFVSVLSEDEIEERAYKKTPEYKAYEKSPEHRKALFEAGKLDTKMAQDINLLEALSSENGRRKVATLTIKASLGAPSIQVVASGLNGKKYVIALLDPLKDKPIVIGEKTNIDGEIDDLYPIPLEKIEDLDGVRLFWGASMPSGTSDVYKIRVIIKQKNEIIPNGSIEYDNKMSFFFTVDGRTFKVLD